MNKKIIEKRVSDLWDDTVMIGQQIMLMSKAEQYEDPEVFQNIVSEAALRSELMTCRMRHLLYEYTNIRKPNYLAKAAEMQGMAIREYPDMIEIEVPCLFPKRKQRLSSEYLTDPLYFMLDKYTDSHPIEKYTDCVVCFVHEYDRELPDRRIRDYDNIEQKQILDVISTFVLKDDSGMCCDTYNSTALADEDKTRIFIMSRDRFCTWLAEQSTN